MHTLYFLIAVFVGRTTNAALPCPPTRDMISNDRDLIENVNQFDDADRRVKKKYSEENDVTEAELDERYGGSGDLNCGTEWSQGQVAVKNDRIIISAHALGYADHCTKPILPPSSCRLYLDIGGKKVPYDIDTVIDTPMKCPRDSESTLDPTDDWAVLKLKKAVDPRVKPYKVSTTKVGSDNETKLGAVFVAKSADFNPTRARDWEVSRATTAIAKAARVSAEPTRLKYKPIATWITFLRAVACFCRDQSPRWWQSEKAGEKYARMVRVARGREPSRGAVGAVAWLVSTTA